MLGEPGQGAAALGQALALGALARTAEMVGAAQRILDLVVEHARVRVQNGRPIGAYQAIQHACADSLRDVETSRWLLYQSAWRHQTGRDPVEAIALAKAHAGPACLRVARRGHQALGAIGYCEEHPLHLLHKRIHAASLDVGDASHHLEIVADALGLRSGHRDSSC
jgi:alkylation response protein AidB-like acyl-CoA dehydrogenase